MVGEKTIHDVTYDLSRSLGLTRVFGNHDFTCAPVSIFTADGKAAR